MSGDFDFIKMHGAGNDFIMIEDMHEEFDPSARLVSSLCARHTGIGADGLILLRPSADADFRMRYYNRDGGEAEMCGNGARCAAKFAVISSVAGPSMVFDTGAGRISAEVLPGGVRIGMTDVKGFNPRVRLIDSRAEVSFAVSGVPHAALLDDTDDGWPDGDFLKFASSVRNDPAFKPAGTNFSLVRVEGRHQISYRTFERGVEAETLACGTGAVAAAVIASQAGRTSSPVSCRTKGGDVLEVEFSLVEDGAVGCFLKGPAVISFRGACRASEFLP